jgi:hypothetical protein
MFIRIPKTAGTSVGEALSAAPLWEWSSRTQARGILDAALAKGTNVQTLHWSAEEMESPEIDIASHEFMQTARKLTVVRNPWSRALAYWSFIHRDPRDLHDQWLGSDFEEWCVRLADRLSTGRSEAWRPDLSARQRLEPQTSWTTAVEDPCDILRFEDIDTEFAAFCARNDLGDRGLQHFNAPPVRVNYRDAYTPTSRDAVVLAWGSDAEAFGYDF